MLCETPAHQVRAFFPRRAAACLCVIAWNEGDRLRGQLERLRPFAHLVDIVVADRRSSDGSTEPAYLESMGVRSLLSTDEAGLSTATRMALCYAVNEGYEGVITVDGNGKDGVEAIPRFLAALKDGFDLVQGSRFAPGGSHRNTPVLRRLGIRLLIAPLVAVASGFRYTDPTNAFRAMSRRYLTDPRVEPVRRVFVKFNLQHYLICRAARLGFRVGEIPVDRAYPASGPVPTKVLGLRANLAVFTDLIDVVLGRLDP